MVDQVTGWDIFFVVIALGLLWFVCNVSESEIKLYDKKKKRRKND